MTDPTHETDVLLIAHVHNRPGVLAKIAGIFYRRGLNIRTLTATATREPDVSKVVVRVAGRRPELERLVPAIGNLVDVLTVEMHAVDDARARELCPIELLIDTVARFETSATGGDPNSPKM